MNIDLRLGDCIEILKTLPDNSVDSIVTDPPYGIGFMGKAWDTFVPTNVNNAVKQSEKSYQKTKDDKQDNPNLKGRKNAPIGSKSTFAGTYDLTTKGKNEYQEWCYEWGKECLRVLKPGGHLLASNSPRMYHRMAIGLEDAGFEIRDSIMWIYGSGFPKSHNIGKAIDKRGGESIGWFGEWLKKWRDENQIPQSQVAELFPSKTGGLTGCVSNWELGNNLPTNEQFNKICETFNLPFKSLEEAEREFIGTKTSGIGKAFTKDGWGSGHDEVEITKGQSDWEGWGTALKPAHEPICMARKPLSEKSIAENVLKWGTGGINIDGCRINVSDDEKIKTEGHIRKGNVIGDERTSIGAGQFGDGAFVVGTDLTNGRFPANIMFDDDTDVDWKRYFYCPKTSSKEKNMGLEGVKSSHPTVKPIKLMEYLITLVTPKGGIVMDCFMGSGSTGIAAKNLGFSFIGIEREQEYFDIAKQRIGQSIQTKLDI